MAIRITGLFTGMQNATRALQYAQYALNIHNQNINRSSDPNYTRQELITPSESGTSGPGVKRIRDMFIDDQYRSSTASLGYFDARRDLLGRVEDVFGDPVTGGMRQSLDQFFDKWQALAENPSDGTARLEVLSAGKTLVHQIRFADSQLVQIRQRADEMLLSRVEEVNNHLETIHRLNGRIAVAGNNTPEAADMRDQRDAALDKLSSLIGAQGVELSDGTVRVMIGSVPAVDGPSLSKLTVKGDPPVPGWENFPSITFSGGGEIAGLLSTRGGDLDRIRKDLYALASQLAEKVNTIHAAGYDANGEKGVPFFVPEIPAPPATQDQMNAFLANFAVNPAIAGSPEKVAASGKLGTNPDGTTYPLVSDGSNARKIFLLSEETFMTSSLIPGQPQNPRTFYRNLVGWVGSQARQSQDLGDIAKTHQQLNFQQRQASFGVSMDEEVAMLTLQQKAFAASARVFNVMDEMLDRLINGMGR